MGKTKAQRRSAGKSRRRAPWVTWVIVFGVLGLAGYGLSQMSFIAYKEDDIRVVNFSGLDARQKKTALEAANRARCNCGCGLGLAQCVSTDLTCPIRESNIDVIKGMVREAMTQSPTS